MTDTSPTPMFPLGAVLLPGAVLPLHVFEPRYRDLTAHCIANQTQFGVVLIAKGHEVGGGDIRHEMGCLARIDQAAQTPDGRWGLLCVGTQRIRVLEWLDDDPYPRALVETVSLPRFDAAGSPETVERVEALKVLLRRTLALGAEAGLQLAPATIDLPDDPVEAVWRVGEVAPISQQDRYEMLVSDDWDDRVELLFRTIAGAREIIEFRLKSSAGDDFGA